MKIRNIGRFLCFSSLSGCAYPHAPSFPIVGAYFPGWLICLFIGSMSVPLFRILFLKMGWDSPLTDKFFVYLSLGIIVGLSCWLIWFGR